MWSVFMWLSERYDWSMAMYDALTRGVSFMPRSSLICMTSWWDGPSISMNCPMCGMVSRQMRHFL